MPLEAELLNRTAPLRIKAAQLVDSMQSGTHPSRRTGQSLDFSDLRTYQAGDDLRHIDWRASGKRDHFYVRRYSGERQLRVCLLLDLSSSMTFHHREAWSKERVAIHLAAVIVRIFLSQGDAVGLVLYDEQVIEQIPPLHSQAHEERLFDRLDRCLSNVRTGPTGTASLPSVIHQLVTSMPPIDHWIVLSDFLDVDPGTAALHHTVRFLRARDREVTFFQVLERSIELEFQFEEEEILFEDLETGEWMDAGESHWKEESRRQARVRQEAWKHAMQKAGAEWVEVDTASPLLDPLYQWADRRKIRHGG